MSSDASAAIYNILANDSDTSGTVSTRIYPDALPQNATIPAIVYWRVSGSSTNTIDGSVSGIARGRFTVESYAIKREDANLLSEYVRLALINARGTYDGTQIRNCLVDTHEQHFVENPTDGNSELRYVTSLDYTVHYIEDVS
jgi:hypothetical protein